MIRSAVFALAIAVLAPTAPSVAQDVSSGGLCVAHSGHSVSYPLSRCSVQLAESSESNPLTVWLTWPDGAVTRMEFNGNADLDGDRDQACRQLIGAGRHRDDLLPMVTYLDGECAYMFWRNSPDPVASTFGFDASGRSDMYLCLQAHSTNNTVCFLASDS